MMKLYHKFAEACYNFLKYLAAALTLAMLVLMLTEVVRRYIFSLTWPWSDEIIRYLLIYCTFLGGAAAYYKHALVSFDLITNKLSRFAQDILLLVNNVVCMAFFLFLIWYAYAKMTSNSVVKSISTASGLTGAVPYWGIFAGLIFLFIFTLDFFPELIKNVILSAKGKRGKKGEVA